MHFKGGNTFLSRHRIIGLSRTLALVRDSAIRLSSFTDSAALRLRSAPIRSPDPLLRLHLQTFSSACRRPVRSWTRPQTAIATPYLVRHHPRSVVLLSFALHVGIPTCVHPGLQPAPIARWPHYDGRLISRSCSVSVLYLIRKLICKYLQASRPCPVA